MQAEMIGGAAAEQSQVEAASPISSRPPVDEFGAGAGGLGDEDEPDRGVSGGNRWPRQETLALLRIRSEMDATFRDATLKGPLWEDVSRKLGELGYKRSSKKCKEKFENVHKYYKRTKEGRAGRQDGKTYKFFTELEALNAATTTVSPPPAQNVVVSSPIPITSISYPPNSSQLQAPPFIFRPGFAAETATTIAPPPPPASAGSFSTDSASTSPSPMSEDINYEGSRKRKRRPGNDNKTMEMLEVMMKKVMAEQEAMQRRFLEAVDRREQERTARDEAWRRQESARLAREHELLAHERAVSASRDAAIISFLQKLTGQTIPIPSPAAAPPPPPPPQQYQEQHLQAPAQVSPAPAPAALMAVPEQQVLQEAMMSASTSASRWPKAEVLALIKLRSGLEGRYQEAGPKGPLWEEVSLGMGRMGYKRSSKRCKEKWENINKYFKKVKESNKKRPEDAKTCPYFHQLDALYRKKSLTAQQEPSSTQTPTHDQPQNNNGDRSEAQPSTVAAANLFGEEVTKKPEDIVNEVMMEQQLMVDDYDDKMNESDEDIGEDEDGEEEDEERNGNMEYKIEFQRPNNNSSNGGANNNEAPSFFAMVQ